MSADFSTLLAHLNDELIAHADRDKLEGVWRTVFLARGGHAPGTICPTESTPEAHRYYCEWPDDECVCTDQVSWY